MLRIEGLSSGYERIRVLKDINIHLGKKEIVCLLGANGAGKSTLLRTISGILKAESGKVIFNEMDITNKRPEFIVKIGIGHVPEGRQIFGELSVRQNLMLGRYCKKTEKKELERLMESCFDLFPVLKARLNQRAGTLSGGEQQMLAIARALMSEPEILLFDEPSLGLAPIIVERIMKTIKDLKERGISILIVEQNINAVLEIADRGYVIETGRIVIEGTAEMLMNDNTIKKSYLGM
ncbi:MAG TPA: ABC transporter ATP-binding protein [Syntrophorhabdaceae bacterium]|nr:ABC transporter ATP-binding protein [Syntrophorhabdaceae bacterium]HPP06182.1 ABC transporter ATP-binding protein [Syntrophorhabdaceae bacterium]